MEQGPRDSFIAWPGLFVLLAIAWGLLTSPVSLDSLRPDHGAPPQTSEVIPARLWQDPLEAVSTAAPEALESAESIADEIGKSKHKTLLLPVLIEGGAYSEDHETRLRTRYAVLTGLNAMGFVPEAGKSIGALEVESDRGSDGRPGRIRIAYEWYKANSLARLGSDGSTSHYQRVLLFWVDEMAWEKPFERLLVWLEGLGAGGGQESSLKEDSAGKPSLEVIGPATSAFLRNAPDRDEVRDSAGPRLLSPRSTVDFENLSSGDDRIRPHLPDGLTFRRMIGTDSQLCRLLLQEFALRDLDFGSSEKAVVLISEWDTQYGRNLPRSFQSELCKLLNESNNPADHDCLQAERIKHFTYMRGIDGKLQARTRSASESPASGVRSGEAASAASQSDIKRPVGPSQFDYLRRMGKQLEELSEGRDIGAIGVLGSDVYDKLLILRALRKSFPEALFFTTDLDARLFHPSEYKWTRNLLVASHFGLMLGEGPARRLEGAKAVTEGRTSEEFFESLDVTGLPRFRDGYQTATFLAVLVALRGPDEEIPHLPNWPRLYEIGRKGPVLLNPRDVDPNPWLLWIWIGLPTLAAATLIALRTLRGQRQATNEPQRTARIRAAFKRALIYQGAFLALFVLLAIDAQDPSGEKLALFKGVSIWPSQFILLLTAVIGVEFYLGANKRFDAVKADIWHDFFGKKPDSSERPALPRSQASWFQRAWEWFRRPIPFRRGDLVSDNESPRCSWRMIDVEKAWAIFDAETTPKARRRRNRPLWIVAALIVAYVVSSVPARPYRGDLVRWVDLVLLVLATGVGFWVYVVVVDITRCTSSLMRALSGKESAWPQGGLGAGSPDGRPENRSGLLSEWLDTRLMADLTQVTGGLIYYPFILMLIWGLAHHPIFDNWIVGLEELLNWIGVVALACFPMIVMRQAAGTAQKSAQKRQHTKLMGLLGNDRADDARVLEACIREVRAIRDGAFSPVSQNPVVRAMLIQFGGIGGIAILETLLN